MERKKYFFLLILVCLMFSLAVTPAAAGQPSKYRLQPTDVISITVHGQPDLTTKTRVSSDGFITFPLLGKVKAEGFTVQELEESLKEKLEAHYLVNAQVLVFIEEYHPRQVSIVGEVTKPGKYDMPQEKDITLLETVAMAEGFTKDADLKNVKVMRTENGEQKVIKINVKDITVRGKKDKDIVLKPDDVIVVPESFF